MATTRNYSAVITKLNQGSIEDERGIRTALATDSDTVNHLVGKFKNMLLSLPITPDTVWDVTIKIEINPEKVTQG